MNNQDINGSANQQAAGDIYNYPAVPEVACISGAQAFQLKWLVESIEYLLNHYDKHSSAAQIWADLHDYCHTPAPLPSDKRSQYRLMPATNFHRAKSYLLEKMWVARLTGKSKRKVKLYFNGVSQSSDDDYYDDANPDVVQKYLKKCDEVDELKQQIEKLNRELVDKYNEIQELTPEHPVSKTKPDGSTSDISAWSCVSAGISRASVDHCGYMDSQSMTDIVLDFSQDGGISLQLEQKEGTCGNVLYINMVGGCERRNFSTLLSQVILELDKGKDELGGKYDYSDESGWNREFCTLTGKTEDLSYLSSVRSVNPE